MLLAQPLQAPDRKVDLISTVQYLRCLAALMVVWEHATIQLPSLISMLPPSFGYAGVDIFFVISGFIMVLTTWGKAITPGSFMVRRLVRIVPLYWATTMAVVALVLAAPKYFRTTDVSWQYIVQSLLFVPYWSPTHPGEVRPVLVPGWTLNNEMFFYALFAAALWLPKRRRLAVLAATLVALVLVGAFFGPFGSAAAALYTNVRMLEFLFGAVVARLWMQNRLQLPVAVSLALLLLGAVSLLVMVLTNARPAIAVVAASVCIVVGSLNARWKALHLPLMKALGDASYSIYLTHLFALGALRVIWPKLMGQPVSTPAALGFVTTGLLLAALTGWIAYRFFELPVTAWLSRWLVARPVRLPVASVSAG